MPHNSGTWTFLFTDIVDSSGQWERSSRSMYELVSAHHEIVRACAEARRGGAFKSLGDGVACVFDNAHDAILAGIEAQLQLVNKVPELGVRIGVNSGFAEEIVGDFLGTAVNRVSRLTDLACGGQVLVSTTTLALARDYLDADVLIRLIGDVALEGHLQPEAVYQVWRDGMPSEFPPISQAACWPEQNIPLLERPFVGREIERELLADLVRSTENRLVTVLGFGGIGKTTLATVVAGDLLPEFENRVYWVDCDGLDSAEAVLNSVAVALGEYSELEDVQETLVERIGTESVLVVLDCYEGLVATHSNLDSLLQKCPGLHFLVTSRILLGSHWEVEFPLRGFDSQGRSQAIEDSVELFAQGAKRCKPDFELNRSNRAVITRIVQTLEFIPLAIILAAGRMRYLDVQSIENQLSESLLQNVKSAVDKEGRHSGLQKVIEASFNLLDEELRRVAICLSVFEGGFSHEHGVEVLRRAYPEDDPDCIFALRDNSLLNVTTRQRSTRFKALDSVREFLRMASEREEWSRIAKIHAGVFVPYCKQIGELILVDEANAVRLVQKEIGNLRAALQFILQSGDRELSLCYADGLCRALLESGYVTDFANLAQFAIKNQPGGELQLELHGLLGIYNRRKGDIAGAAQHYENKLVLAEATSDSAAYLDALGELCSVYVMLGSWSELESALRKFDALPDHAKTDKARAEFVTLEAQAFEKQGDIEHAVAFAQNALDIVDHVVSFVHYNCSLILVRGGCAEKAEKHFMEFARFGAQNQRPYETAQALLGLARAYYALKRTEDAERILILLRDVPLPRGSALKNEVVELNSTAPRDKVHKSGSNWSEAVLAMCD